MTNIPENPTFPLAEYAERTRRLRAALRERGIDALVVTSPANLFWLSDYQASWYPPRLPVALVVWAEKPETLFVDWTRHEEFLPYDALYTEAFFVDYGTAPLALAEELARRSPRARIALEWSSPTPVPAVMNGISDTLTGHGCTVLAGDWIVDQLRLHKSPAEQERVRRAGEIADVTFRGLQERLRPGMTGLEIAALVTTLMSEQGAEVPAQHPLVAAGPTAWRNVHGFPSSRPVERDDVISIDASAVVDRYHVNLCRVFSFHDEHPRVIELLDAARASLDTLLQEARPGDDPATAMAAAERTLRERVPGDDVWWTGGYSLGIAFPPSWVGHGYLANDGPTPVSLQPGWVSNFESILRDRAAHTEAAAIDTVLMTEDGMTALSSIPRALIVID